MRLLSRRHQEPTGPCCWVASGDPADGPMCDEHGRVVGERVAIESQTGFVDDGTFRFGACAGSSGSVHNGLDRHGSDAPVRGRGREVAGS